MTSSSHASVVVSTLDRPEALARCLDSVWSGEARPSEIVVVDQSAGDDSRLVCESRRSAGAPVVYVRQERRGLGASQNLAVRTASSPVVAVIDDDCIADARWLRVVHDALAPGEVDLVAGRVLPLPAVGDRAWPVSSRTSTVRRTFDRRSMPWDVGSGNNFAFRRDAFLEVGGCDERLGPGSPARGGVDMDLFYRFLRAGKRVRYEPDAVVHHERQTWEERRARRPMYARGMGASCGIWLARGDVRAARLVAGWAALRARILLRSVVRGDLTAAREELVMLGGTLPGIAHGVRMEREARSRVRS